MGTGCESLLARGPRAGANRLAGLDAARGMAMLLVCLSHFGHLYLGLLGLEEAEEGMSRLTLAATPAFVLVSGLVLGFLHSTRREEKAFRELRRRLLDRALFLLTVAHLLIVGAHLPKFGFPVALDFVFITDVVAVCVVVGTAVVPTVRARSRIARGGALYVAATLLALVWMPAPGSIPQLAKHLLVGHSPTLEQSMFVYNFPILQWLVLYLVATTLGETLTQRRAENGAPEAVALAGLGVALMGSGAVLRVLRPALHHLPTLGSRAAFLTSSSQKLPLGPAFLLCYSGLALCLVAGCLWLCRVSPGTLVARAFGLVGRNSTVGPPAATAWAERLTRGPRTQAPGSADPGWDIPRAVAPARAADRSGFRSVARGAGRGERVLSFAR